jgi:Icc-related predicted phosphoesterase
MKIVAIADLQGQGPKINPKLIPAGDLLLIAGDLTTWGKEEELKECNKWLGSLPHTHKVVIGGNHDSGLENGIGKKIFTNATYLENELIEIEGVKIWGSPVNEMNNIFWFRAFADNQKELCDLIPKDLDILLTHGGPYMVLDKLINGEHVGSKYILEAVIRAKPKFHVFGHIHESYGKYEDKNTIYLNVATLDEQNNFFKNSKLLHEPVEFEIK